MFNKSRSEKIIGANFSYLFEVTHNNESSTAQVELLINPKGSLVDFSVQAPQRIAEIFISLLESLLKKNFEKIAKPSLIHQYTEDQLIKTYWWQLLDEVHFHFSPVLDSILENKEDLLCRCFGVSKQEVEKAIANGAQDVLTITNLTKAAGGCGNCVEDIQSLIATPARVIESNEEETKSVYKAKYPREKLMGMWPAQFIIKELVPMFEDYNQKEGQAWKVEALVENHLYISNSASEKEFKTLEDYISKNSLDLAIFYS